MSINSTTFYTWSLFFTFHEVYRTCSSQELMSMSMSFLLQCWVLGVAIILQLLFLLLSLYRCVLRYWQESLRKTRQPQRKKVQSKPRSDIKPGAKVKKAWLYILQWSQNIHRSQNMQRSQKKLQRNVIVVRSKVSFAAGRTFRFLATLQFLLFTLNVAVLCSMRSENCNFWA